LWDQKFAESGGFAELTDVRPVKIGDRYRDGENDAQSLSPNPLKSAASPVLVIPGLP
jgi:hypothetical protein